MAVRPADLSLRPDRLEDAGLRGDVVSLGLLRSVQYRQIEARAPWGLDVGGRSRAMLYLIVRGAARLEVHREEPRELAVGQVVFVPRDTPHVLRDAPTTVPSAVCKGDGRLAPATRRIGGRGARTSIVTVFFDGSLTPPALLERRAEVVVLSKDGGAVDPQVGRTLELVLAEIERPGPASTVMLQRLADVLVVHVLRALARGGGCRAHARQHGLVPLADPKVNEAIALLHGNVQHGWTVAELAARVGLSRSGLAARFTGLVGEPPLQYLARWRIARAAQLLRDTEDTVGAVAARVGYESAPSFIKAFKRWHGTSPGAYRRIASSA